MTTVEWIPLAISGVTLFVIPGAVYFVRAENKAQAALSERAAEKRQAELLECITTIRLDMTRELGKLEGRLGVVENTQRGHDQEITRLREWKHDVNNELATKTLQRHHREA